MAPPETGTDSEPATRGDVRRVHSRLDELIDRIDKRYVSKEIFELTMKAMDQSREQLAATVNSHGKWLEWAQRLVIGAVALAVIALIIKSP